jgi:hypothetical protein
MNIPRQVHGSGGKEKARAGMSGYLGETKDATYTLQILASNSHVVVAQVDQQFLMKQENGIWTPWKRSNITVFEVERGKSLGFLTTDAIVEITGLLHPFRMDPLIVMKPR